MIPGLGQMILLGDLVTQLESDPDLTIVLDSPSSGHAITMFESPDNYKEMLKKGLLVQDIDKIKNIILKNR